MDQTVDQIAAHIGDTRARLGANVRELERQVDALTDWRTQFRAHPYAWLGAACLGGVLLARQTPSRGPGPLGLVADGHGRDARRRIGDLWDDIAAALFGVAAVKVKDSIAEIVPGFDAEFARVTRRTGADPRA